MDSLIFDTLGFDDDCGNQKFIHYLLEPTLITVFLIGNYYHYFVTNWVIAVI